MAKPKIFVSSTCYDLNTVRAQLKRFIESLGYEPVLSEYGDVVYDPRQHTHTSCVAEVANCDVLVVIIGGRFGGTAVDEARKAVDAATLDELTSAWRVEASTGPDQASIPAAAVSITQLEVVRAVQLNIPVFGLVERRVWGDHAVYESNGGAASVPNIKFPSVQKQETAKYIFEFLNFLRRRKTSNSLREFDTAQDIEEYLRKQWAGLYQRLLAEQRRGTAEQQALTDISQQIDGLRAALLSAVQDDKKSVASTVLKHRTVLEIAYSLVRSDLTRLADEGKSWDDVLSTARVTEVMSIVASVNQRGLIDRLVLKLGDGTFWRSKYGFSTWSELGKAWADFVALPQQTRKSAAEAIVSDELEARMLTKDDRQYEDVFTVDQLEAASGTAGQ